MTPEEAVEILKGAIKKPNTKDGYLGQALDMAIKALETTEQVNTSHNGVQMFPKGAFKAIYEDNEDCISREAVIRLAEQYPLIIGARCSGLIADIKHLPSVTPKFTDAEIQKMQDLEQAQLEKAYELGKAEMQPSEDCISRKETIEWLKKVTVTDGITFKTGFKQILYDIEQMPSVTPKASEQQPSREWKEIYAESEGSNSWIEFKCPHCGYSFGMESGEYDWHYGDEIPWKYCPICGGSAEHKPYKAESEE